VFRQLFGLGALIEGVVVPVLFGIAQKVVDAVDVDGVGVERVAQVALHKLVLVLCTDADAFVALALSQKYGDLFAVQCC
jgi:hypothetical protein